MPSSRDDSRPFDLTLTGMAYGGDAFGRDDSGRMVFLPFAIPGEKVHVQVTEQHERWCRAQLLDVLLPASERALPRCVHYAVCGGCHYQHIDYAAQCAIKQGIVQAQLERLGKLDQPPVAATVASPEPWNTRNHIQFSLAPDARLGFLEARSARVLAIRECHLPEPGLNQLWPHIELDPFPGLDRVALRTAGADDHMIIFHSEEDLEPEVDLGLPASLVWVGPSGARVLAGSPALAIGVHGRSFQVHAQSFFQVHTRLAASLIDLVLEALEPAPGQIAFDLYAGVGLFSASLAERGARVVAIEQSAAACRDFIANLDAFEGVDLYEASVEDALPALPDSPNLTVVDPPRAGLGRQVVEALLRKGPRRLAYVSCDPSTLARDGRLLADGGYHLERVTPVDLFPQTYHVETVSLWTR